MTICISLHFILSQSNVPYSCSATVQDRVHVNEDGHFKTSPVGGSEVGGSQSLSERNT